jgi:hypothetical protein
MAVLPEGLARSLELPEEVRIGGEERPLLYGSPALDQFIRVATQTIPLMFGHIEVPYLKKAGFDKQLAQDFVFTNAKVHVTSRADARTTYMVMFARYIALSDERKEGLVELSVHENTGAVVEEFETLWQQQHPMFYTQSTLPPHFPVHVDQAVNSALQAARICAEAHLTDFTSSMKRRLRRDVNNTREYYGALQQEMQASLANPNLGEAQKEERMAKIQDLPNEMQRKIDDLKHKYQIRLSVHGCAVLRFLVDVAKVMVEIHHKKFKRPAHLTWNPVTGRFDPLVCEQCQTTIREVFFLSDKSDLKLVCAACGQK